VTDVLGFFAAQRAKQRVQSLVVLDDHSGCDVGTHAWFAQAQASELDEMAVRGYFEVDDGEPEDLNANYEDDEDDEDDEGCGWP